MEAAPNPKESLLCEECGLNPSKYKCPSCSIRSCSLPCVKSHKQHTSCTGKRSRSQFVPISQFDDDLLISDYNLLEEVKRIAESAKRRRDDGRFGHFQFNKFKLPHKLQRLKNAAARQKTGLLFLPMGMTKREKNQTRFDNRKKSISWTVEWRFHSTNVVLIDNWVDGNMSLCSVIQKHLLDPGPWNNQLKPFCKEQLDSLKFFIRTNAKGFKSPFRELDIKAPFNQQLANTVILEYPVIHVFLPSAIKDMDPFLQKAVSDMDFPSPKDVLDREVEIEDDVSDPYILDLMKYMEADDNVYSESITKELGLAEDSNFDFGQDLRDAFASLIDEANPDEFLDFDEFVDQGWIVDGELEEGEIPAS